MFACVVEVVFGDFHHQVFIGQHGLTAQTRLGFQAPCLVKQVFFEHAGFGHAVETLAHDDVACGAGTGFFAGVVNVDVVFEQNVANSQACGGIFDGFAFGAKGGVRQHGDFGHGSVSDLLCVGVIVPQTGVVEKQANPYGLY